MSGLLEWALAYAAREWPVLPLHGVDGDRCTCGQADCSSPAKHPRTRNGLKDASTSEDAVRSWWGRWPGANIGLRTGVAFDVLDVDGDEGWDAVNEVEAEYGPAPAGPTTHTGGGGLHRLYQPTGVGNKAGLLNHVDWRGQNGYIVAPPSLHISGNYYEWSTDLDINCALSEVAGWLKDLLFPPEPGHRPGAQVSRLNGNTGAYARRAFDAELGELARAGQGTRNHTLNAAAFNLYQLVYGGELDELEVTSALTNVALGIGLGEREVTATLTSARNGAVKTPRSAPALSVVTRSAAPAAHRPQHSSGPGPAAEPDPDIIPESDIPEGGIEPTSWEPVDIAAVIAGGCEIPPPTMYKRSDGICLIYPGKIHAFNGEPESGKSWAAQHAAVQAIGEGLEVCYIDFEDSPESVIGRLLALGATTHALTDRLSYMSPDKPLSIDATDVLREHFGAHRPNLVVIDGMTEAMSILGLDPLDNADSAKFFRILPRRLSKLGAAVIIVDHVTKDREDRGRWAIGAQHKMAALTGAAFTIDIVKAFGRNKAGFSKITVTKDRPGYIRQHAAGTVIAELHVQSDEKTVTAELRAPLRTEDGSHRPTSIMEKISRTLEGTSAKTASELEGLVKVRKTDYHGARSILVDEGYVQAHKNGNSVFYSSFKAYRADTDPKLLAADQEGEDDEDPF